MQRSNVMQRSLSLLLMMGLLWSFAACDYFGDGGEPGGKLPGGANVDSVAYTASEAVLANPERGFYRYSATHPGDYSPVDASTVRSYRTSQNVTLLFRYFFLDDFRDGPISAAYLQKMEADFDALRESGAKVVLRFAYTEDTDPAFEPPHNDAPKERILQHIEQVAPLLQANSDVIAVVQAGFIGIWGEWYYTDYFADPENPSDISEAQYGDRKEVLTALLDALPEDRMGQIRTIPLKQELYDTGSGAAAALGDEMGYSGTDRARVGYHNDCFLASETDYGTYSSGQLEADKAYLAQDSRYVPVGGETCNVNPPRSSCETALEELERFHWSYLNSQYQPDVLAGWQASGCYGEVERRLGYRFTLQDAQATAEAQPGAGLALTVHLTNDGWAAPYNPRTAEVVLRHQDSGDRYVAALPSDPRRWFAGEAVTLDATLALPSDLPEGTYDVLLYLPDAAPSLDRRADYAIRMANEDVWEAETGFNDLQLDVAVSASGPAVEYGGDALDVVPFDAAHPEE